MQRARDMYTGRPVRRPNPAVNERYQFDFTCDGDWLYLNSFDHTSDEQLQRQKRLVCDYGERWRIVDAWTGETVEQSSTLTFASRLESFLENVVARYLTSHRHT